MMNVKDLVLSLIDIAADKYIGLCNMICRVMMALGIMLGFAFDTQAQKDVTVDTHIRSVTVFLNRAQVTREMKARITAGETNLILSGLSARLDPQSIQVSGTGGVVLMGIQHNQNYLDDASVPGKLKVFQDSLDYLGQALEKEQNLKDILVKEEQLILANQKIGGTQQNLSVSELKAMADFFRSRLSEIGLSEIKVDGAIKQLGERITKLKKQLVEQRGLYNQNTSEIVVTVSSRVATTASLEVSYVVSHAGWYPVYDLRATDTKSPIQLGYKANVFQQTGESWENVKLTLSTANPALGGQKPELYTWYLDFAKPPVYKNAVRGAASQAPLRVSPSVMPESSAESMESLSDYVSESQTSLNIAFEISLPYSVSSSAKPTMVDIRNYEMKATYQYSVAPKLDRDAFLLAKAIGWEDFNLLPGEANVFFEGTFVGKTFINPDNVRDTLSVSLGRDKRIVVQREKRKDFTTQHTIGTSRRDLYAWQISIRNTKNEPIKITIEDHVPVSQNSQIEVSVENNGRAKYSSETGKLIWEVSLEPNETRKLDYSYEVKYPKDKIIPGL
jgi:uncharacterized protein (TIGR02231 family)